MTIHYQSLCWDAAAEPAVAGRIPSRELSHHAATTAAAITAPSTVASVAEAPCGGSTQKCSACLHSDSLGK